ncbi:OPT oligopeptide transporter [Athelia psychrophila]|uniref:OPT oligopeptide transporter n=1 Tax=Athelia psychrophila TaxID=1759441 RepID=A0A166UZC1_9AGAM|nr:OPT oligopeptide transporter [Fibularhizoctonia sp. CBS 109695]
MEMKPEYDDIAAQVVALPTLTDTPRHVPDVPQDAEFDDFMMEHFNDPNFDLHKRSKLNMASVESLPNKKDAAFKEGGSDFDTESHVESTGYSDAPMSDFTDFDDESPYPEVRASVASIDDPTMPVSTFRMWTLGLFYTVVISALNQFFSMRYPSVVITGIAAQLTSLPLGKFMARYLPTTRFRTFGYVWSFNPGPFNIKEHVCITVMANVVVGGAYATDIVAAQRVFYGQQLGWSYQIMLILSTQIIGFSLGGLLRRFLVWPSSMIWPGALVNCALFNTLHKSYGQVDGRHMSREKFFCIALACSFTYYWLPGYLFTALSVFNWVCWIAPENVVVNQLFGTMSGLGMGVLTFDWAMISYVGSPLVTPWWSEANTVASLILCFFVVTPIWYYTNTFYTAFLPISSHYAFDNTGNHFDPTAILTDGAFDAAKYEAYSPLLIPATLCMAYALSFASAAAILVHTFIWYRRDITRRFTHALKDERDIHSRLMQSYPEVPQYWYGTLGLSALVLLIITITIYPTGLPVWAMFIALFMACLLTIPVGMLQAITNQQVTLQVLHEMLAGYMLPGHPVANMIFKCIAYIGTNQAVGFAADLKLGHYMKIPPRTMFLAQVVAAFVSCFVVTLVQDWMFSNIPDFCTLGQVNGFRCPGTSTFATASMIWGGVGPARLFSVGKMYNPLLYFFLIGAIAPIPFYFLARRYPLSLWRYVNIPVFFTGVGAMPPASGINYSSWALTGFAFQWFMRRFHFRWWMRYNYILSAALDAGVALGLIVIFFTVQFPKNGTIGANTVQKWWGNTGYMNTADALGTPYLQTPPGTTFGPATW